jgi:hypothetical protein
VSNGQYCVDADAIIVTKMGRTRDPFVVAAGLADFRFVLLSKVENVRYLIHVVEFVLHLVFQAGSQGSLCVRCRLLFLFLFGFSFRFLWFVCQPCGYTHYATTHKTKKLRD